LDFRHVVRHHDIWDLHACPGAGFPIDLILKDAANKLQSLKGGFGHASR
jgi:hypothetical protein